MTIYRLRLLWSALLFYTFILTSAWALDVVPLASVSRCDPKSLEYQMMLKSFPPKELNSWMMDETGKCPACLDPAHPKYDKTSGYLIINPSSGTVLGKSMGNMGSAVWEQVKSIPELLESVAKIGVKTCVAGYDYVRTAGEDNQFIPALQHQKVEFKKQVFANYSQKEMVQAVNSFCQTGDFQVKTGVTRDNAQFLFLQFEQCMGMGYVPKTQTIAAMNKYYNEHRLTKTASPLSLNLKQVAPISVEELVEKFRRFESFTPQLTSSQEDYAIRGLDQVLAQMTVISAIQGSACLPSPFRTMIEGTVAGNLFDPLVVLKVMKWVNKSKILKGRAISEASPNSLKVKYSPKQIGLYSSQIAYSKLVPLAGRVPQKVETKLKSMAIKSKKSISGTHKNEVFEVTLEDGTKGIWKPHAEKLESNYRTEVLSYEFDQKFNFDLVPPTVERVVDGKKGSMQLFIEKPDQYATPWKSDYEEARQWTFDYLTAQGDRHPGNWFVDQHGKFVSIDNGISFNNITSPHRLNWVDVRKPITQFLATEEGRAIMVELKATDFNAFKKEMSGYIGERQAEKAIERMKFLMKHFDEKVKP